METREIRIPRRQGIYRGGWCHEWESSVAAAVAAFRVCDAEAGRYFASPGWFECAACGEWYTRDFEYTECRRCGAVTWQSKLRTFGKHDRHTLAQSDITRESRYATRERREAAAGQIVVWRNGPDQSLIEGRPGFEDGTKFQVIETDSIAKFGEPSAAQFALAAPGSGVVLYRFVGKFLSNNFRWINEPFECKVRRWWNLFVAIPRRYRRAYCPSEWAISRALHDLKSM